MSVPEVSVVIPSYNHERFVMVAVDSVLNQTFKNIELIVIDDGSLDNSSSLLVEGLQNIPNVTFIRQKNAGSHATINRGLKLARAPWMAILNSDDVWAPDRLEVMLASAQRSGSNFLFSDTDLIDSDGHPITDETHWWNMSIARMRERVETHGVDDGLLYGNFAVSTSNFLFRREVLTKLVGFRHYRYNLDWDFILRCSFDPDTRVEYVPKRLLQYRLHGQNAILSGMPVAAIEAQEITRRIYREYFGASESLILSHGRHDRLLRKYFGGQNNRLEATNRDLAVDRDGLTELLQKRQTLIDAERNASAHRIEMFAADLALMEASRNELGALLNERQQLIDNERSASAAERLAYEERLARYEERLAGTEVQLANMHIRAVRTALQRDVLACRAARVAERIIEYRRKFCEWEADEAAKGMVARIIQLFHRKGEKQSRPAHILTDDINQQYGQVRRSVPGPLVISSSRPRVAAHVHLYYIELATELFASLALVDGLQKVVVTGPYDLVSLEPHLGPLRQICPDIRVDRVLNRGKDIGGLVYAIQQHQLLDSDYVIKIHSKKSQNPSTYFEAISALFGMRITDGDQWRRALMEPLVGTAERTANIIQSFESDCRIGMVGAAPFITTAPDANSTLYEETCAKFGVPLGMSFVAGTMFWIRSSLLSPLLDNLLGLDDFDVDSTAVEGGLEHIMERILGAFVLARGFDLVGVES